MVDIYPDIVNQSRLSLSIRWKRDQHDHVTVRWRQGKISGLLEPTLDDVTPIFQI